MYCSQDFTDISANLEQARLSSEQASAEFDKLALQIILTTANSLEGYRIVETVEVISSECVFGINIFHDLFAGLTDIFGGRSYTTQQVLRDARRTCLYELKREAAALGANAVIAIDLDYSESSGKGKSMLFLVATGTAVRVERVRVE